jgi:hypothetical protein
MRVSHNRNSRHRQSAAQIARSLGGKPSGRGYFLVRCPAHEDREPSLSISDGDSGLRVNCFAGCTPRDVYAALRERYLLADNGSRPATPRAKEEDRSNAQIAQWLWAQRQPISEGTPPFLYLHKRGYTGPISATLAYLPARAPHPAAMLAAFGMPSEPEPGILAAPTIVTGVHRTRLTAAGDKAPDADGKAKRMLGACMGTPIVIAPPNDLFGLAVTEGIEDALSVYAATGLGVWAAGSARFMPALAPLIPSYIEVVTIYAHPESAGQDNAHALARELRARRGHSLEIRIMPP